MLSKDLLAMESSQHNNHQIHNNDNDDFAMETIPSQMSPVKKKSIKQGFSLDRVNSKITTQATNVAGGSLH